MSIFRYLKKRANVSSASLAKERLQIIISHERASAKQNALGSTPDYLPKLQEEILAVIAKYFPITQDKVSVNLERSGDSAVLELNVMMPDEARQDED